MIYTLMIPQAFPGMNQFIGAINRNRFVGARMKADAEAVARVMIRKDLKGVKITRPVILHYRYFEENRRRDLDNIAGFAHKVIQDALVREGVLENDGWKQVKGFTDTFYIDKDCPRILLKIEEIED